MDGLPQRRLRRMFYVVEINLILWIAAFAASFHGTDTGWANWTLGQPPAR